MPLIPLTVYKQESIYLDPPVVRYVNTDHIIHIWDIQWYKTQADEDAKTNRDGTQINLTVDGIVYSTWIVEELAADIAAASSGGGGGGGGTPTTQYSTVTFPFSQTINYLVGDVQQSVLFTEDFASFTELHAGTISVNNLSIKDKKHYKDLIDSANAIVITLPDEAAGVPEIGTTTYYIGYSSAILEQATPDKNSPQWIIKRVIERETGETVTRYAQGNSLLFNLVFDSGLQEYLTYLY